MTEESIFTKIIKGEIPCHKVYEDERTFAFMDIHPIQPGHVLVVTKNPVPTFLDLDKADADAFWATVQRIGKRLKRAYPEKRRIGIMVEGLEVDHLHAKLFPIDDGLEYRQEPATSEPNHDELEKIAQKLALMEDE